MSTPEGPGPGPDDVPQPQPRPRPDGRPGTEPGQGPDAAEGPDTEQPGADRAGAEGPDAEGRRTATGRGLRGCRRGTPPYWTWPGAAGPAPARATGRSASGWACRRPPSSST